MHRLLITGSRTWTDKDTIWAALRNYKAQFTQPVLISGHCPMGADAIAEIAAKELGYAIELYPARWRLYGKSAGFRRNALMVSRDITHCFAFIRNNSAGATHCLGLVNAANIPTKVWHVTDC